MITNYLKVTTRNFFRNKGFSAINIAGLSIGMAAAMLILLWVQNEISYDRFYEKTDRIYLIHSRDKNNGKIDVWNRTSALLAPSLKKDYPEVEDAVRFRNVYFLINAGEKHLNVQGSFADSSFLSVLNFPLLKGNAKTALNDNHSIVITEKLAVKLFGNEQAMGKTVRIDSSDNFTVTAVLKDLPTNTEFEYEYLLPWTYITKLGWDKNQSWSYTNAITYVLLKKGTSQSAFSAKVKNIIRRNITEGDGSTRELIAQPLTMVHLYSKSENGNLVGGRVETVKLFTVIALVILIIACINFMNLSTARSNKRAREVGVRKVIGASKNSLIAHFIGESIILTLVAFFIALCITQISLKGFDEVVGVPLVINYGNPYWWLFALAFILFTGLIAGSYPAFFLSSFRPVQILKGTFKQANSLVSPRKALVVLQFTFAIILIICTIIVERQLRFARNRDTGYYKGDLIYTFSQGDVLKNYKLIKHDLLSTGAAVAVTKTFSPITRVWGTTTGLSWQGSNEADKKTIFLQFDADDDFVKTTGTSLLQGRDININSYPTDSTALLLNEAAVKAMHLQDPVGKIVKNEKGVNCHVIGIIKDFIIESPYEEIKPMIIQGLSNGYPVVHFRLNPANSTAVDLAKAEKIFKQYNQQYPFEYVFANEAFARKFREEQQDGTLAALFAGLTIFISCLGLFGLASYMAETRIKEIGIRKVLGASVGSITTLLSMDFIKLVLLSIIIASPIAWLSMNKWLQGYTYRITIEWWEFLLAGFGALVIALLTVSFQSVKAALANPVKSLRSE